MGLRAVAAPAAGTAPAPSLPKQYHLVAGQPMVLHTQCLRNAGAHARNVRCQARRLGHHGAVDVANLVASRAHPAGCFSQQHGRIRATEGGVGVWKMRANVAQTGRAQQGIGDGVQQHVGV